MKTKKILLIIFFIIIVFNMVEVNAFEHFENNDFIKVILNENDNEINHIEEKQELKIYSESAILIEPYLL